MAKGHSRAGGRRVGSSRPVPGHAFPLWITGFGLAIALLLFFSTTVQALQEHRSLRRVEAERQALHQQLHQATRSFAVQQVSLEYDIQALLVELDRLGKFPAEFLSDPTTAPDMGALEEPDIR